MQKALSTPEGKALFKTKNPIAFVRRLRAAAAPILATMQDDILAAVTGADACVFSYLCGPAVDVHEATGLPAFMGLLQPLVPTRAFPIAAVPVPTLGPFNRISYDLFNLIMIAFFGGIGNRWRRERFGLPPMRSVRRLERLRLPQLCAVSPTVIPRPADWPDYAHMTGYWFLPADAGWQPPAELAAFLADGEPPVTVGFGSMIDDDPAALARTVEEALSLCGRRAVLVGGWGGLKSGSDRCLCVDSVPYEWLYPRVVAAVHHGGAGTTSVALRAGTPQVVVPFFGDQPWWGRLVQRIGAGPAPIARAKLTAPALAAAITAATTDDSIRRRAAEIGEAIRKEDGVRRAVEIIESRPGHDAP